MDKDDAYEPIPILSNGIDGEMMTPLFNARIGELNVRIESREITRAEADAMRVLGPEPHGA